MQTDEEPEVAWMPKIEKADEPLFYRVMEKLRDMFPYKWAKDLAPMIGEAMSENETRDFDVLVKKVRGRITHGE